MHPCFRKELYRIDGKTEEKKRRSLVQYSYAAAVVVSLRDEWKKKWREEKGSEKERKKAEKHRERQHIDTHADITSDDRSTTLLFVIG